MNKQSLSEQLAELSDPKPLSFHPDQEDLEDLTAAKVCSFSYEEEEGEEDGEKGRRTRGRRVKYLDEEDAKYGGKTVTRKHLEMAFDDSDDIETAESDLSDNGGEMDDSLDPSEIADLSLLSNDENEQAFDQSDDESSESADSDLSDDQHVPRSTMASAEEEDDITMTSLSSVQEDIEKGKAAKEQVALFDGALETRIRLQKVLTACNRLPHPETLVQFQQLGGQQVESALNDSQKRLRQLLDNLLQLQKMILSKSKDTQSLVLVGTSSDGCHGDSEAESDEEIASDSEQEEDNDTKCDSLSESEEQDDDVSTKQRLSKKRKRPEWVLSSGRRDYETYVANTHEKFRSFRDITIDKWSKKTKIASGKITSKAFVHVEHSALSQIEHVLKDKDRLVKRTQLKRSVYRVLGTHDQTTCRKASGEDNGEEESSGQDKHLHNYDQEIFDDDDFYHQLLRELIERKMSYSESSDPTAMGRQWLELQKLRTKAKKTVDTKASKGRKIRYNTHPKLTNFMAPLKKGTMSDISRNDLFASLFGGQHLT